MTDVLFNSPSPADADPSPATDVAGWLGNLLDAARDREDAPLARLIAGVIDDFRRASAK